MTSDINVFPQPTVGRQDTEDDSPQLLTIGTLRDIIQRLDDQVAVSIAVRDRHHFNVLLGGLPVVGASVTNGGCVPVLVLDVVGVT